MRTVHYTFCAVAAVLLLLIIVTCGGTMDSKPWVGASGNIEGKVAALSSPKGARVTLDETFAAVAGNDGSFTFPLVAPGTHLVEVESEAYKYQGSRWLEVKAGETTEVEVDLLPRQGVGNVVGSLSDDDIPGLDSFSIQDITGYGDIVILCDSTRGFFVVDASDITDPLYLGRNSDGRPCESAVVDWPLIMTGWDASSGGGVGVYSLEDPASPGKLSEVVTANSVFGVELLGQYLYALGDSRFQVFDVSDPLNIRLVSWLPLNGEGLMGRGNYLYLSTNPEVLTVVDVSDPLSPVVVDQSLELEPNSSRDSFLWGDYAYIALSDKVYIYDVRDPEDIRFRDVVDAAMLESQGASLGGGTLSLEGLAVFDDILYLGAHSDGMVVVDHSDASRPRYSWQTDAGVPFAMNVYIDEPYAHVAARIYGYRAVRIR